MAIDKAIDSAKLEADLTTVADAIRERGETSDALSFPDGMAEAVLAIRGGGGAYEVVSTDNPDGTQNIAISDAGEDPTLDGLSVQENGVYTPQSGHAYGQVSVNVPTGTPRSASDVTASGATVTVPAGLYGSQVQKTVASGTAGTPTASKGTVSDHSVQVTPSVTNAAGYIPGGTKSGTPVTVTAGELVSGDREVTAGTATQSGIDVTNYETVSVAPTPSESRSATPSLAQQTVTPGSGKLLSSVTVDAITKELLATLEADFVAGNIKKDVDLFGLVGTYEGGGGSIEPLKSVSYSSNGTYTVNPSAGYDGVQKVNVSVNVPSAEAYEEIVPCTISRSSGYVQAFVPYPQTAYGHMCRIEQDAEKGASAIIDDFVARITIVSLTLYGLHDGEGYWSFTSIDGENVASYAGAPGQVAPFYVAFDDDGIAVRLNQAVNIDFMDCDYWAVWM